MRRTQIQQIHRSNCSPVFQLFFNLRLKHGITLLTLLLSLLMPCLAFSDTNRTTPQQKKYYEDVWQRVADGISWHTPDHKLVKQEYNWYLNHPDYIDRVSRRASRYLFFVAEQIDHYDVPMELALLPIIESAYDPFAYSPGSASGMWQFISSTGKSYGLEENWWYDGRRDVVRSTDAAIRYLIRLQKYYKGDWLLALAAYNSGIGNVNKAIRYNRKRHRATDFWSISSQLPAETRGYVPRLLAISAVLKNNADLKLPFNPIANEAYFETVYIGEQIDLSQVEKLTGLDIDEIYRLNPGLNRWATPPQGPHELNIPVHAVTNFKIALAQLPHSQRVKWFHYKVKSGDALSVIASRHHTTADHLQKLNGLSSHNIRVGQELIIASAIKKDDYYQHSVEQRIARVQQSRGKGVQIYHTVKPGDSFWEISRKYNTTVNKLAHWNGMAPRDILKPGQQLVIWKKSGNEYQRDKSRPGTLRKITYSVRNGDSLYRIAKKFSVDVHEIAGWNKLDTSRYLKPGQNLTLYVDVTR